MVYGECLFNSRSKKAVISNIASASRKRNILENFRSRCNTKCKMYEATLRVRSIVRTIIS